MWESKQEREAREAARKASRFTKNDNPRTQSLAEFRREWDRIEREKAEAPKKAALAKLTAAQEEHQQLLRVKQREIAAFWSRSTAQLESEITKAVADDIGEYEKTGAVVEGDTLDILRDFFDGMKGLQPPVTFSPEAEYKVAAFMRTNVYRLGVDYNLANLCESVHRLVDMGVLKHNADIFGFESYAHKAEPKVAATPTPTKPTIDEVLDGVEIESRSGRLTAVKAVNSAVFQDTASAFSKFVSECKNFFGSDFALTQTEAEYLAALLDARNLSATQVASWHQGRRLAAKSGNIRPFLTNPERFDIESGILIENFSGNTTADKIELNRRIGELKQKYGVA